jgi:hypothetical protein
MDNIGKILKCTECKQEKKIYFEEFSELLHREIISCKECHDHFHEIVKCVKCGKEMIREDYLDHLRDRHDD